MTVTVNIVSAETSIFSGQADMVVATAEAGELGVRKGHTPLLACLKPGQIRLLTDGTDEEAVFYVSSGYIEVQPQVVTVLADTAARAQDIDEAAALEAEKRAREALDDKEDQIEYAHALTQLAQASAQLAALRRLQKMGK